MKRGLTTIFLLLTLLNAANAQSARYIDSLRHELSIATHDSTRMVALIKIGQYLRGNKPDSAIYYASRGLILARKFNSPELELEAMIHITLSYIFLGNESSALKVNLEAKKLAEINSLTQKKIGILAQRALIYNMSNNYSEALSSYRTVKKLADSTNNIFWIIVGRSNLAHTFLYLNQIDSALFYGHVAYEIAQKFNREQTHSEYALGKIYFEKGDHDLALKYLHESVQSSHDSRNTFNRLLMIAEVYHQIRVPDSSIYYGTEALKISLENKLYSSVIEANTLLSEIYKNRDLEKALQYSNSAMAYRDTLDMLRKNATMEAFFNFDEQERQNEIEMATASYQNKVQRLWIFSIAGALISAMLLALILYRNNKNKQRANAKLKEQKEEIESTLEKLESTQTQLIHSEKMASLGELTAGIAHEIQNPLNFVNNFSEVSAELLDELQSELNMNNPDVAREIAGDLKQNLEKIHHHGQRASGIVKGMLEHSRAGDGQKVPTDINTLADEYLRLAYHGLRAKDKTFNADFKTDLDASVPEINVVPQDIARVLLNLINNAFYAASSKATLSQSKGATEENDYRPEVIVSTKLSPAGGGQGEDAVEISVKDNGPGIPEQVREKIFQPFFTTKPTGHGTGLGLSLSYDIITKGHQGRLELESKEGEGTEFTIILPKN